GAASQFAGSVPPLTEPQHQAPLPEPANPQALKDAGDADFQQGDYDAAVEKYSEAIKQGLSRWDVLMARAAAVRKIGWKHMSRASCLGQLSARTAEEEGEKKAEEITGGNAFLEAIKDYNAADPLKQDGRAQAGIGYCELELGDYPKAEDHLLTA